MADEPEPEVVEKRGRGRPRKTRPVPEEDHQSELSVLFDSLESKLSATLTSLIAEAILPLRALVFERVKDLEERLSKSVAELKQNLLQRVEALEASVASRVTHSATIESPRPTNPTRAVLLAPESSLSTHVTSLRQPATKLVSSDRRFNIVVYGIPEMPSGSSRFIRQRHDFREVSAAISDLEQCSDHSSSIRDCRRLGKYVTSKSESKHRPILVSLNSTADVDNILSSRSKLQSSPISIKPDLTPAERKTNALLLKERWRLIQSGTDRRSIRIRGSSILLNGQIHGIVSNSVFSLSPILGDVAPQLSSLEAESPPMHTTTVAHQLLSSDPVSTVRVAPQHPHFSLEALPSSASPAVLTSSASISSNKEKE